jgi:hypothetical protein
MLALILYLALVEKSRPMIGQSGVMVAFDGGEHDAEEDLLVGN